LFPLPHLLLAYSLSTSAPRLFPLSFCSLPIPSLRSAFHLFPLPSTPHLFALLLAYSLSSLSSSYIHFVFSAPRLFLLFPLLLTYSFSSLCSSLRVQF
jgi:hypothetical protein